jgi:hypothetical protein
MQHFSSDWQQMDLLARSRDSKSAAKSLERFIHKHEMLPSLVGIAAFTVYSAASLLLDAAF